MVILRVEIDSNEDPKLFHAISRLLTGDMVALDSKVFPSEPSSGSWQPYIYGELATKVFECLKDGQWIQAIKHVRQDRGLGLKEGKEAVNNYREYLRRTGYLPVDRGSEFRTERAFRS